MNILHVVESSKGGISTYLSNLLRYQVSRYGRENITLICPEEHVDEIDLFGCTVVSYKMGASRGISSLLNLVRVCFAVSNESCFDVVHLHSSFSGFIFRIFSIFGRSRIIYCPHGWSYERELSSIKAFFYRKVEYLLSFRCCKIICISKFEYESAVKNDIDPDFLSLVVNGVEAVPISTIDQNFDDFDDSKVNFLFVGRFDRQKGLDLLLNSFSLLNDESKHLHVIGDSVLNDNHISLERKCTFHGWRSKEYVHAMMSKCDCLVVPSRWEGFGLVVQEAYSKNLPVIVSDSGGLPEQVINGKTGYIFPSGNINELSKIISNQNKVTLNELSLNLELKPFGDKYSVRFLEEAIHKVYSEVVF